MTTTRVRLAVNHDRIKRFLAGKRIQAKMGAHVDVELSDDEVNSLKRKFPDSFLSATVEADEKAARQREQAERTRMQASADAKAKAEADAAKPKEAPARRQG